jgi:hypothetical protein
MDQTIRPIVRAVYDIQKLRIAIGNRVAASFRAKLGLLPGEKEDQAEEKDGQLLQQLRSEYKLLSDAYAAEGSKITSRNFKKTGIFENYAELDLVRNYLKLREDEEAFFKTLEFFVEATPLWQNFLKDVRGCGPAMAGVILSEIDFSKAKYASSIWQYAGLGLGPDGRGTGRYKEHLIDREYTDKNDETKVRKSITFNPFLKTKMIGVLGSSFVKQPADKCKYRKIYDDYKHRLECHPQWEHRTKAHRHNAAVRYMIKQFMIDLYVAGRTLEGLPVYDPYHEAKLGLKHSEAA